MVGSKDRSAGGLRLDQNQQHRLEERRCCPVLGDSSIVFRRISLQQETWV